MIIIGLLIEIFHSKESYITLKVYKRGNIYIFGDNSHGITCSYEYAPLPDEIHINGVNQTEIKKAYDLDETENTIKLIWKDSIIRTTCMFLMCKDIAEIDLSNFDSSQVTHLHAMFYGCSSLTKINLSNFNSPQAEDITRLFKDCSSLTSVDLSSFSPSTQLTEVYGIFDSCSSLEYANLENLNLDYNSMFNYISNKVIICNK